MNNKQVKKNHHFVHDAYISAWKTTGRIFVLNRLTGHTFDPTGRSSVAAIRGFNNFSFDPVVLALISQTFSEKAASGKNDNIHKMMLFFLSFMKDYDYEHKKENFIEDFFSNLESVIGEAFRDILHGDIQIVSSDPNTFDRLVIFYCLQLMRTKKMRDNLSREVNEIFYGPKALDQEQKEEYLKMNLIINSLAMATNILEKGCVIKLRYTSQGGKFINSDAPAIILSNDIKRDEDIRGCIPISPKLLMEIDSVGCGFKLMNYNEISYFDVDKVNIWMINNSQEYIYFSSSTQRKKYMDIMRIKMQEKVRK